jgi:hypothetical protein
MSRKAKTNDGWVRDGEADSKTQSFQKGRMYIHYTRGTSRPWSLRKLDSRGYVVEVLGNYVLLRDAKKAGDDLI